MNEVTSRIDLDSKMIQSSVTFPFYADSIISVTQNWESNTSNGRMYTKWKYNKKNNALDIIINTNLLDDSSYLEIIYFNQQLMRDKKIEEILK